MTKKNMRNNAILNSYFSSLSPGVFSLFHLFASRYFIFSLFRVAFFRYFVFSRGVILSRHNAKDEKNDMRKDEITKRHQAKRRNNEKTPGEKAI